MKRTAMIAIGMIVLAVTSPISFGEYTIGYQWDYQNLFSSDNSYPGLSAMDSEGNRTFEYRYSVNDGTPDTSTLMGYYNSGDATWQPASSGNGYQNIGQSVLYAGDQAIQIHWVAPISGYYHFTITANGINGGTTREIVWVKGVPVDSSSSANSSYSYTSSSIQLNAGEKIVFLFCGVSSPAVNVGSLGMVVTKDETPITPTYEAGYQWNYQSLFGTDPGHPGLSAEDVAGYRAFQYRYTNNISAAPSDSYLMGAYHSWETASDEGGWQRDNAATYAERIRESSIVVDGGGTAAMVEWVAPIDGYYNVYITANNISDDNWATQEKVWIAGVLIDTAQWFGTNTGYGSSYGFYRSRVQLSAGDVVAFLFSGWGSTYAMISSFDMTVTLCPEAYPDGYVWNYQTQFGTDNGSPGLSTPDALNNRVFQYRYSDCGGTPDSSTLMGSYHSWSSTGWQPTSSREWEAQIYSNKLLTLGTSAAQVHFVAPQAGLYSVSITATDITDNGWATQEKVWVNGELKNEATWLGTDTGHGDDFSWSETNIQLEAGDVVAFLFSSWGSSYATMASFDMTVTLVLPDTTLIADCSGNIGTVKSKLAGVSQGGDSCSYLKSDVVERIAPLGLKLVRLEAVPGNSYYNIYNPQTGQYNWTNLDQEIENIKSTGADIMLNIFYMPQWLSSDPNGAYQFTLPSSMSQWKTLIGAIVHHVNIEKGYNIKYWEFWNEPSGVWAFEPWDDVLPLPYGGQYKFANFYAETASAIKAADPTALVGGFGDNCSGTSKFTTFFTICASLNAPIDFLTVHLYGAWNSNGLQHPEYFSTYPGNVDVAFYNKFSYHVPVFMTEWNSDVNTQVTTAEQQVGFMAKALYWMQQGVVEGSCFFRVENFNSMDRSAMDGARYVREAGRVLQMWALLPSQLSQMSIDSTTGISTVAARGNGKVAVMISRYDLSNSDPIRLQLLLDQHGLSGNCTMTRYIEDATTTGNQGSLNSRSRITIDTSSSTPIEALVTLENYSAALIVVEEENAPVLSVSPASRSVDRTAGTASFTVNNSGTGTLTWTTQVIYGGSWLSISSGSNGTNSGTINVAYTANSSWTATRSGTIRITANGATGSPIDVTVVQVKGRLPGDANEDDAVDVGDLGILAANYGGTGKSWNQGDFNGDGLVDVGDLGILAANYGTSASSANWATDYAQAFGTTVDDESSDEEDTVGYSVCSALGLPLIAGLVLMGLMLGKLEE